MTKRRGFSLVELMITLVILGVMTTALSMLLQRQQRFYRAESGLINLRSQLRQASDILPGEIRGLSSADASPIADIYSMSDTAIDIRSTFGTTVVCSKVGNTQIILPPSTTAKANVLTSWMRAPQAGDSILVYDDAGTSGGLGTWNVHRITSVASGAGACPTSSGYTQAADAGNTAYTLTVSPNLNTTIIAGAPVRLFNRVHYALYQTSGKWYLGYFSCSASCGSLEQISGPYKSYVSSGSGQNGLQFVFRDTLGNVTAVPRDVARIQLTLRGESTKAVAVGAAGMSTDSVTLDVALRNRR
jgi:prepilin-type N-terminal cleavage/methylation domain-containing protein